jgi:hypothetical protein
MSQKQAELEADIERQREALANTVDQLSEQVQARARTTARQAAVIAGAAVVVALVVIVVKRSRS